MTPPPSPTPAPVTLPQACDGTPHYGILKVGTKVILGRHKVVNGDDNWNPGMDQYVGKTTKVISKDGVDPEGCTVVSVAIDGGQWAWRVRAMKLP